MASPADIVIYGGSAGGGKSWALLIEPLRHAHNGKFGAVIFRRTYKQVTNEGGLWDESLNIYPLLGATMRDGELDYKFPSGASVKFAHLQHEKNALDWQGAQVPLIGWDELTHFSEYQFWYMLSRNRSTCGVRPYMRATTNPDADSWVARLIEWWIDPDTGYAIDERSGVVRWFVRIGSELHWSDSPDELRTRFGDEVEPKSLTFIAASLDDNPALTQKDPGYRANLLAQPPVEQERLLRGNWKIRPEAGKVFDRGWFSVVDAAPATGSVVRFWDDAATEKKTAGDDPDYSVGLRLRSYAGRYYVEDVQRFREAPAEADRRIRNTAAQDGQWVRVAWEIEPGSSGKRVNAQRVQMLAGYDCAGYTPTGDKLQRANPVAAQALAGNIDIVRGPWNEAFLNELHNFPDGAHDDIVDALSGAFNAITTGIRRRRSREY